MKFNEITLIPLISVTVLLGVFLLWYKNPNLVNKILLTFPVVVGLFVITEGVFWEMVTGHPLFNIPAFTGIMLMIVSCFTIPFAILRGAIRGAK